MRKFVTLIITDKPNAIDIIGRADSVRVAAQEIEIVPQRENLVKKDLGSWLKWAKYQIEKMNFDVPKI